MEVNMTSTDGTGTVPVSFETVVTETGVLQLWCVARDGRRWKLEVQRSRTCRPMKIGIDLGTTNSSSRLGGPPAKPRTSTIRPSTSSKYRSS